MRTDICLLLEGTYPYVAGGVSTWVQQILESMPQYTFSIVFIGPSHSMPRELKYTVPPNVVEIHEAFVHDYPPMKFTPDPDEYFTEAEWVLLERFSHAAHDSDPLNLSEVLEVVRRCPDETKFMRVLCHSLKMWERVKAQYRLNATQGLSFLDFFWTWRFVNIPTLRLLRMPLPRARVYHSASTGYAGVLGSKAAIETGRPFLLTEHGIYTRERRIEIFNAQWIRDHTSSKISLDLEHRTNYFKEWWVRYFLSMSRTAYRQANTILSLFEANRQSQIADGAEPQKVFNIPNGIYVKPYLEMPRRDRKPDESFQIGFIGRVASIKDLKTLLRALEILSRQKTAFDAWICGPMDEEEDYARECRDLTRALDIHEQVHYEGRIDVKAYLPRFDVVVLSSISEGLPFVILEANCAGIPVVSTDVGACRELLEGRNPDDCSRGPSGLLVQVASPGEMAAALTRLAKDPDLCRRMGDTGRRRVQSEYDIDDVMDAYRDLYEQHFYLPSRETEMKAET